MCAAGEWHDMTQWGTLAWGLWAEVIWFPWQQCRILANVVTVLAPEFLQLEWVKLFFFFAFSFVLLSFKVWGIWFLRSRTPVYSAHWLVYFCKLLILKLRVKLHVPHMRKHDRHTITPKHSVNINFHLFIWGLTVLFL